jgi:hypothetical protein
MQSHPLDAFDKFETISNMVKKTDLRYKDAKQDDLINHQPSMTHERRL